MLIFAQLVGAAIGVLIVRGGVVIKDCDIFPNIARLCPPNFFEDKKIISCDYTEGK